MGFFLTSKRRKNTTLYIYKKKMTVKEICIRARAQKMYEKKTKKKYLKNTTVKSLPSHEAC